MDTPLSPASIQSMLRTMATLQAQMQLGGGVGASIGASIGALGGATPGVTSPTGLAGAAPSSFGTVVERAIEAVNTQQAEAKGLRERYEQGEPVALTDVVIQMQKASLAFEATLQVRNKVMKAYEDILNMPL